MKDENLDCDSWWNKKLNAYKDIIGIQSVRKAFKKIIDLLSLENSNIEQYLDSTSLFKDEYII